MALCALSFSMYAQEDLGKLINDGKAALEQKDYTTAFDNFSNYLIQTNNQDSVIAFNCGLCADKIQKYDEAVKYFDVAIAKGYNLENSYVAKAQSLKNAGKEAAYLSTLKDGMKALPQSTVFVDQYKKFYNNKIAKAQKAKKAGETIKACEDLLAFDAKNTTALYVLGATYYQQGAAQMKTNPNAAKTTFKKAQTYFNKVTPLLKGANDAKRLANVTAMQKYITSVVK